LLIINYTSKDIVPDSAVSKPRDSSKNWSQSCSFEHDLSFSEKHLTILRLISEYYLHTNPHHCLLPNKQICITLYTKVHMHSGT